jgi:DNA (cytosine-5)-methyltransferase 1
MLTIGSLFSGIGGLELGLEWAGLGPVRWQVEINAYARGVLARHWPDAERFEDVRSVGEKVLSPVDLICGGFPCQNLSHANVRTRYGLAGEASGLWSEFRRVVSELSPRFVVVENISDGWGEWVPVVRRDLHEFGYASVPIRVRAEDVGAPFKGARVFVVAASYRNGESTRALNAKVAELCSSPDVGWQDWGQPPPSALGMADGIPHRMERLHAVGNAVVPQCAEVIGHVILATVQP